MRFLKLSQESIIKHLYIDTLCMNNLQVIKKSSSLKHRQESIIKHLYIKTICKNKLHIIKNSSLNLGQL